MSEIYQLDQNQVKLSKIDNRLTIAIEAYPSGRSFSIELDNDAIAQASNEIFADADAMHNGFVEALKKEYKEVLLTFDDNGKLSYKLSFSVGSIRKEHEFTLSLQEKKLSQISLVEKKLENLQKVVDNIERKHQEGLEKFSERISADNNKVIEMINNLETIICEKLDTFEKRIASLEKKKESKSFEKEICKGFNPNLPQSLGFIFSNENKTIQWKNGKFELPILESLPQKGKVTISIIVEKIKTSFWIGLALVTRHQEDCWFRNDIRFIAPTGKIEKNSASVNHTFGNNYLFKIGDTITMILDINLGNVSFQVNNAEVNSLEVDLKNTAYFPYCGLNRPDDQVTLISAQFEE